MKTKMFLTSMLVMSLALPAYATEGTLQTAAGATSVANGCKQDPLTAAQVSANAASFTAQWAAHSWEVSFNGNGSTAGSKSAVSCTYDESCDLTNTPTTSGFNKTGHTFNGWAKGSASGSAVSATNAVHNELYTVNGTGNGGTAVTLFAKWTPNVYTVTLDPKHYASSSASATANSPTSNGTTTIYEKYGVGYYKESGATNQITTTVAYGTLPSYTGYTFDGYWTTKSGSGTQILDGSGKLKSGASTTLFSNNSGVLYAKWNANAHTIAYNCGTGSGTPSTTPQNINFNDTFTLQNAVSGSGNAAAVAGCSKVGYHATSWTCKYLDGANGTESTTLTSGSTYNKDVNATCTLGWAANTIDLSWALDGGASTATNTGTGGSAKTCTYGGNITLPDAEPTKTGYTFSGWKLD